MDFLYIEVKVLGCLSHAEGVRHLKCILLSNLRPRKKTKDLPFVWFWVQEHWFPNERPWVQNLNGWMDGSQSVDVLHWMASRRRLYLVWDNFSLALEILNSLIGLLPGDYKEMGSLGPWSSWVWGMNEERLWILTSLLPGHWVLAAILATEGIRRGSRAAVEARGACTDLQSWSQTANGRWTWFSLRCDERPWGSPCAAFVSRAFSSVFPFP